MMKTSLTIGAFALSTMIALSSQAATAASIVVGSANFPESEVLATIYAKALTAKGIPAETKLNIGSREVYIHALTDGSIDAFPEYSGSALSYLDKTSTASAPDDVAAALQKVLPAGISMLKISAAEDTDVIAVTKETADKYKLKSIADFAPVAATLVLGGPPEMKARRQGVLGLKDLYGITFKSFKSLDEAGPLTVAALTNGQVAAADMFSTDPAMKQFVALEDPKHMYSAQNIVPLIATKKLDDKVTGVLNAVSAALTTEDLLAMNADLGNHESFDSVATKWLASHKLN